MADLKITPDQSKIIKDLQCSFQFMHTNSMLPPRGTGTPHREIKPSFALNPAQTAESTLRNYRPRPSSCC